MAAPTLVYHVSRICNGTPTTIAGELNRIVTTAVGGTVITVMPRQSIVPLTEGNTGPYPSGYHAVDIIWTTGK